ncbi:MAG: lipoate--protein ligase family protein [Candidatus Omnitrophica bacterium]|nr:lipoate--protein ligase family protein [Candidatus Omnitrophota bacterium]
MQNHWRLILDEKHNGYHNMAVDESLLFHFSEQKMPTLRLYGWHKPWVSLGYSQKAFEVVRNQKIPIVRRISGGAAILHDKELTYSLVCSLADLNLPYKVKPAYCKLAGFLKDFYSSLGLEAFFAQDLGKKELGTYGNFCFSSWQHFDLIISGKKIGGNAQRRKKDIIFQQGSIPQQIDSGLIKATFKNISHCLDRATCLDSLLKEKTDFDDLKGKLADSFKNNFNIQFVKGNLSEKENKTADFLFENKYQNIVWNLKHEKAALVQ